MPNHQWRPYKSPISLRHIIDLVVTVIGAAFIILKIGSDTKVSFMDITIEGTIEQL